MFCANCGTQVAETAAACDSCGTQVPRSAPLVGTVAPPAFIEDPLKRCPYCGEQIMREAIRCKHCQTDLSRPLVPQSSGGVTVQGPNIPAASAGQPTIVIQNVHTQQGPQAMVYREIKNPGVALLLSIIFPGGGQFYNGHAGKGILVLLTCWMVIPVIWSWFDAYNCAKRINRTGA